MLYNSDNPVVQHKQITLEDYERKEFKKENIKFKLLKSFHRRTSKLDVVFYQSEIFSAIAFPKCR